MKAPDKIYVGDYDIVTTCGIYALKREDNSEIVYIRKDALLEWAEGEKKTLLAETNGEDMDVGRHDMITRIIEKLQSL